MSLLLRNGKVLFGGFRLLFGEMNSPFGASGLACRWCSLLFSCTCRLCGIVGMSLLQNFEFCLHDFNFGFSCPRLLDRCFAIIFSHACLILSCYPRFFGGTCSCVGFLSMSKSRISILFGGVRLLVRNVDIAVPIVERVVRQLFLSFVGLAL